MRQHPHLFEISAWPWLTRLSRQADRLVTLDDVPGAEWDRIAAGGFDYVFLMGVWRRSAVGRMIARTDQALLSEYDRVLPGWTMADVPGSPYCIEAYEPDARMGGWAGVDAARRALAARDLRLILDFVPNHTGFDHPWVTASPDRYVLGTFEDYRRNPDDFRPVERDGDVLFVACGRDPYFAPWRDVAQLNYFNPDTRAALTSTVAKIASHCDGVRCDMAMLVLNDIFDRTWRRLLGARWPRLTADFWRDVTRAVPSLNSPRSTGISKGDARSGVLMPTTSGCSTHCTARRTSAGHPRSSGLDRPSRVTSRASSKTTTSLGAPPRSRAGSAPGRARLDCPGMRFFYDGQFEGRRVKLPVQLGRWPDESPDAGIRRFTTGCSARRRRRSRR